MSGRRPTLLRLATVAVLVLAGTLFATSAAASGGGALRSDASDLPSLVAREERRVDTRTADVDELRRQVDDLSAAQGDPATRRLTARAEALGGAAAVDGLTGPGVQVVLDDAPRGAGVAATTADVDPDLLLVHQEDLQAVVNALWAGGARGVSLMDQPLITTSAVRCVGSTLRLQGRLYAPPYRVRAVGDPDALVDALDAAPRVEEYRRFQSLGLGWDLTREDAVSVPAWEGPLQLRWAEPMAP